VQPGDIPKLEGNEQQRVPRPHQALLDPTGEFIVLPDLGSDRLRVLRVDKQALQVTDTVSTVLSSSVSRTWQISDSMCVTLQGKDLVFKRGSGPRHAVFFKSGTNTFLYIITELSNRLLGYKVSYENDKTLEFTSIQDLSTHGGQEALPDHYKGSEILISVS
jgi:3-carboxymuconate cyclase